LKVVDNANCELLLKILDEAIDLSSTVDSPVLLVLSGPNFDSIKRVKENTDGFTNYFAFRGYKNFVVAFDPEPELRLIARIWVGAAAKYRISFESESAKALFICNY